MREYEPFTRIGDKYPVNAVLDRTSYGYCLTLQAKVRFTDLRWKKDGASLRQNKNKVLAGFRSWKGSYLLQSGETLAVRVYLQETKKRHGAVKVLFYDGGSLKGAEILAGKGKLGKKIARALRTPGFALAAWKPENWRPWKNAPVGIRTDMERFPADELSRHEFGHVLGLGDLYRDPLLGLNGITGSAAEYFLSCRKQNGRYHAVMDDNGPVTDTDAEMMLLAQTSGRFQQYQKQNGKGTVSAVIDGNKGESTI